MSEQSQPLSRPVASGITQPENDQRINATYPAFEAALKAAGVPFQVHVYPGTQHGFHNNSTPRYDEAAARLSWERTVAHFKKHLATTDPKRGAPQ